MDDQEIYAVLGSIFNEVFDREIELRPDLSAKPVQGWDSLKQIIIIVAVEERFGLRFTTQELDRLGNIGDLAQVIRRKAV